MYINTSGTDLGVETNVISAKSSNAGTQNPISGNFMKVLAMQMEGWARSMSNDQITQGEINAINNIRSEADMPATGEDQGAVVYTGSAAAFMASIRTSQVSNEMQFIWGVFQNVTNLWDKAGQLINT